MSSTILQLQTKLLNCLHRFITIDELIMIIYTYAIDILHAGLFREHDSSTTSFGPGIYVSIQQVVLPDLFYAQLHCINPNAQDIADFHANFYNSQNKSQKKLLEFYLARNGQDLQLQCDISPFYRWICNGRDLRLQCDISPFYRWIKSILFTYPHANNTNDIFDDGVWMC